MRKGGRSSQWRRLDAYDAYDEDDDDDHNGDGYDGNWWEMTMMMITIA